MESTFLLNCKIHDLVSRIATCLALPSTTNPTNSNVNDVDGVSSNITKTIFMLNFQNLRYPSLTVNWLSGKDFGVGFPQAFIIQKIYSTLLNAYIWKVFKVKMFNVLL